MMKFVYGKQDWKTMERGQENCYLLTNGLGGFSSSTMIGSNTRNDHALLMAAIQAPNYRCNMIHRLEEVLIRPESDSEKSIHFSTQEFLEKPAEQGYRYLDSMTFEDIPRWRFLIEGVEIVKEIAMKQGENLVAVRYHVKNRSKQNVYVEVIPHFQFVEKGQLLTSKQVFLLEKNRISSEGKNVYFQTDGEVIPFEGEFCEGYYYAYDDCDGRCNHGNTYKNHKITKEFLAGQTDTLSILYTMSEAMPSVSDVFSEAVTYRENLVKQAKVSHPLAKMLVKAANQFVAYRESTEGQTILAGYPFFEDWGRDTMIALSGCCICSGQLSVAKSVLRTFAKHCQNGLMPNLFPEGGQKPIYNTVDASLLFVHALYLYYEASKDLDFVKEMWTVLETIIEYYQMGTDFHIYMDHDGLISAGAGLEQVTWMDVRIGDILPTPRHGKPVEINAYWYNALCIRDAFAGVLGYQTKYHALAQKVKKSFQEQFWNEKQGCLRDVISGTDADDQIRCNQIWAVSMPFAILDQEKEKQVVNMVYEKLYTPYGLRTLDMADPEFHQEYGGMQEKRDLAYHQGTVWPFPLGAYYLAYLKVNNWSGEAMDEVEEQLGALESALREGCIGQLPEIYDGGIPNSSKGCFAQAWSVGELLRVFVKIEEKKSRV